jgi:hypothetical protein
VSIYSRHRAGICLRGGQGSGCQPSEHVPSVLINTFFSVISSTSSGLCQKGL